MPKKSKQLMLRIMWAVPLIAVGVWAFSWGGYWWGMFLIILAIPMNGEVIYQRVTCHDRTAGWLWHCLLLVFCGNLGFWVMFQLRHTKQGTALIFIGAVMVIFFDTFSLLSGWVLARNGGHKITRESPNKTWEGLIGGTLLSMAAGIYTLQQVEHRYTVISINRTAMYLLLLILPVVAFFGDLNESMAKRRLFKNRRSPKSIKDFSQLLGPHGGLCDRFDAMTAVFATVGLVWLWLV